MYKASELMKMEFLIVIATKVGRRCGRGGKTALLIHIQAIYVQGRRGNEKHIFHRYSHENGKYKGTAFQSINCGYVLFFCDAVHGNMFFCTALSIASGAYT